ncbi:hypothetical protein ZEAMMB73_Zm00001d039075 [Zea mays]|uniref:Uncharacterized protein n=1 Tax=Zea mays TaxID=4577 RepID=A0A1D6MDF6_MAIZE|nr:hypothetical protein ZEAMMB73_Zm00001d039075 [Zea mays]
MRSQRLRLFLTKRNTNKAQDDYHEYFKRSFEEDIAAQVPQGVEWGLQLLMGGNQAEEGMLTDQVVRQNFLTILKFIILAVADAPFCDGPSKPSNSGYSTPL